MSVNKSKKIVFVSNYYNHHQAPLLSAFYKLTGGSFCFIETSQMSEERKNLGYGGWTIPEYVLQSWSSIESKELCENICNNAEIVITGCSLDKFLEKRVLQNKLIFRYNERFFKRGRWRLFRPKTLLYYYKNHFKLRNKNVYMLCASAYTASDCRFIHCYKNKTFKWGYFPEVKKYIDIDKIIEEKTNNSLLWVARFIDWKHPEIPITIAKKLKENGYSFKLNMIGTGSLFDEIDQLIKKEHLDDCVSLLGPMSPERVRENMEQSEIFLFTSDKQEGWGAVLNESMNSGCAVVANKAIGSVPYLIKDGENGVVYKDGDLNDVYQKVKYLLNNAEERRALGKAAYKTMIEVWNADVAAQRFIKISDAILLGQDTNLYTDGPCSK